MNNIKTGLLSLIITSIVTTGCISDGSTNNNAWSEGEHGVKQTIESIGLDVAPCVATFTEDFDVVDYFFGDKMFTARVGDQFMMGSLNNRFGSTKAELYYLTQNGPYEFEIKLSDSLTTFPFQTDCVMDETDTYMGVFKDTKIYSDSTTTDLVCTIPKGTSKQVNGSGRRLTMADPREGDYVYELLPNPFADECGDSETGFVIVDLTEVFDSPTTLIPLSTYIVAQ